MDAALGAAEGLRGALPEQAGAVHAAVHAAHRRHRREAAVRNAGPIAEPRHWHPTCARERCHVHLLRFGSHLRTCIRACLRPFFNKSSRCQGTYAPLGPWVSLAFWLGRRGHRWMPCRRHARLRVVAQMPSDAAASCRQAEDTITLRGSGHCQALDHMTSSAVPHNRRPKARGWHIS